MLGGAKIGSKWVMRKVFYWLRLRRWLRERRIFCEPAMSCRLDVGGSAMRGRAYSPWICGDPVPRPSAQAGMGRAFGPKGGGHIHLLLTATFSCKIFETLCFDGIYHWFGPTMRRLPRPRIYLAPLFNCSILGGGFVPGYLFVGHGVRWFGGLTCDFAECF